ncbi:unnamed protein product [Bubo scandiacus]
MLSLLLLLVAGGSRAAVLPDSRVVNGEDAKPYSWPWQISLQYERDGTFRHTCGGSLIAPDWVMTAAHCISSSRTYEVVLGEYDMGAGEGPEQRIPVDPADIFVHPKWRSSCVACGATRGVPLNCQAADGHWEVHGIASFVSGLGCNAPKKPTVFTRVSAFEDWIAEVGDRGHGVLGCQDVRVLGAPGDKGMGPPLRRPEAPGMAPSRRPRARAGHGCGSPTASCPPSPAVASQPPPPARDRRTKSPFTGDPVAASTPGTPQLGHPRSPNPTQAPSRDGAAPPSPVVPNRLRKPPCPLAGPTPGTVTQPAKLFLI